MKCSSTHTASIAIEHWLVCASGAVGALANGCGSVARETPWSQEGSSLFGTIGKKCQRYRRTDMTWSSLEIANAIVTLVVTGKESDIKQDAVGSSGLETLLMPMEAMSVPSMIRSANNCCHHHPLWCEELLLGSRWTQRKHGPNSQTGYQQTHRSEHHE